MTRTASIAAIIHLSLQAARDAPSGFASRVPRRRGFGPARRTRQRRAKASITLNVTAVSSLGATSISESKGTFNSRLSALLLKHGL